jgi:PAS domain S-box-containing protein
MGETGKEAERVHGISGPGGRVKERALEEVKERYRLLVELIPDALWVSDDQVAWFAKPAAARLLGAATPGELMGRALTQVFHPDSHSQVQERTRLVMAGNHLLPPERRKAVRMDAEVVDVETAVGPRATSGESGAWFVLAGISPRVFETRRPSFARTRRSPATWSGWRSSTRPSGSCWNIARRRAFRMTRTCEPPWTGW